MSGNFSFSDLNLKDTEISKGSNMLAPGKYKCDTKEAEWKTTANGGKQIVVTFTDVGGGGSIKSWLTVFNPTSPDATRIGREQLKAVLVYGGHPTPDDIGSSGLGSLNDLTVGVAVKEDTYTDRNGNPKKGSAVHYFFDHDKEVGASITNETSDDLSDSIPF